MSAIVGLTKDYQGDVLIDGLNTTTAAEDDVLIVVNNNLGGGGNDLNPGTPAQPLLTLDKAMSLLPVAYRKSCTVECVPSPGDYSLAVGNYSVPEGVGQSATPFLLELPLSDSGLGIRATTVADPTGHFVTDAALTMAPNAFRGATVKILTGTGAGRARRVISNTATSLFFSVSVGGGISLGATFEVLTKGGNIALGDADATNFSGARIGIYGPNFISSSGGATLQFYCDVVPYCSFDLNGAVVQCKGQRTSNGGDFSTLTPLGAGDIILWNGSPNNPFNPRDKSGIFMNSAIFNLQENSFADINLVCDSTFVATARNGFTTLYGLNSTNSSFSAAFDSSLLAVAGGSVPVTCDTDFMGEGAIFEAFSNSNVRVGIDGAGVLSNSSGDAVLIGAIGVFSRCAGEVNNCSGTGSAGYGINCQGMSQVKATGSTVNGTAGDTLVGAVPKLYAALPYSEQAVAAPFEPTLNRIEV